MKIRAIKYILLLDIIILVFGTMNFISFFDKSSLPERYSNKIKSFSYNIDDIESGIKILEFEGNRIDSPELLDYHLMNHKIGEKVSILINDSGVKKMENTSLVALYDITDLVIMISVTLFYFFTAVFFLLRYRSNKFAVVIHYLCIATGLMIICDWGTFYSYPKIISYLLFVLFEIGTFLVPALFIHFAFNFPTIGSKKKFVFWVPFYLAGVTFLIISVINITDIFFFGKDIYESNFLLFHTTIADVLLVLGLILTVAKLEHSAININDTLYRKKIYWALLGISFGPLIYIFLIVLPRLIMQVELVSNAFMHFTILIAPIMLLISVTRKNEKNPINNKLRTVYRSNNV